MDSGKTINSEQNSKLDNWGNPIWDNIKNYFFTHMISCFSHAVCNGRKSSFSFDNDSGTFIVFWFSDNDLECVSVRKMEEDMDMCVYPSDGNDAWSLYKLLKTLY